MKKLICLLSIVGMILFSTFGAWAAGNSQATSAATSQAGVNNDVNSPAVSINGSRQSLQAQDVYPLNVPLIIGGKIGDVTVIMPTFANSALTPLQKGDIVEDILAVYSCHWRHPLWHITYEEIESFVIDKGHQYENRKDVRYSVKYKDAAWGLGGGGNASAVGTGNDSLTTGGVTGLIGITSSEHSPHFFVTFYRVKK